MTTATENWTEEAIEVAGNRLRLIKGGSGKPLVFLHHSTGSLGWLPIHDELAKSFTVIVPDIPGYGGSDRPEWAVSQRDLAILLHQAIETLSLEGVTLVGAGFGGFIAAEMATMNQSRLSNLVLIGAAGLQPREGHILDQMMMDYPDYIRSSFANDDEYVKHFGETPPEDVLTLWDHSREMTARVNWKPYMWSPTLGHLLGGISTPTLLIWGSDDKVVLPVVGQQYADAIPGSKLDIVAGAGHLIEMEDPSGVAAKIAAHAG